MKIISDTVIQFLMDAQLKQRCLIGKNTSEPVQSIFVISQQGITSWTKARGDSNATYQ